MRRHSLVVLILWLVLTVVGELLALRVNIFPVAAAEEAEHIDGAFRLLVMLGVPVFMFVVVVLAYSVIRFRTADGELEEGPPPEEGPPIYGHRPFTIAWLVITSILAFVLFYNPGYTGLVYLRSNPNEDMVVKVEAAQWHWHITYPEYDLTIKSKPIGFELMDRNAVMALPVDRRVKFEVTSADVIHSFWIPAFRMKVDAVPGLVTTMYVTPNRVGSFDEDFNFRVQCAELCGTGHPRMSMQVAVMEPAEFEAWIAAQKQAQMMGDMPMEGGMHMEQGGQAHDDGGDH